MNPGNVRQIIRVSFPAQAAPLSFHRRHFRQRVARCFFLACGSQCYRADASRDVQTGIAFNAERLKRNRPI